MSISPRWADSRMKLCMLSTHTAHLALMAWDEVSLLLLLHFLPHSKSRRESAFDQPVSLDAHKKKKKKTNVEGKKV